MGASTVHEFVPWPTWRTRAQEAGRQGGCATATGDKQGGLRRGACGGGNCGAERAAAGEAERGALGGVRDGARGGVWGGTQAALRCGSRQRTSVRGRARRLCS
jgi:hypothetical protein